MAGMQRSTPSDSFAATSIGEGMSRSDRGSKRTSWLRIPYCEHIDKAGENEKKYRLGYKRGKHDEGTCG